MPDDIIGEWDKQSRDPRRRWHQGDSLEDFKKQQEEARKRAAAGDLGGQAALVGGIDTSPRHINPEEEIERIGKEAERRSKELEAQLWSQARGEETPAQKQFAEQIAQTQRLQAGTVASVRALSGERARRYQDAFGTQLRLAGNQQLQGLRASEMQEAEQALVRFQAARDQLALQYLSMAYSAEEAKRMANMEYEKMLTSWHEEQIRKQIERINQGTQMLGAATGGIGSMLGAFSGKGK